MDGNNKIKRPQREWAYDVGDWYRASIQELSYLAPDRTKWNQIIKEASDFNGGHNPLVHNPLVQNLPDRGF